MGSEIREFFRELFGSRVIQILELQTLQLRQDFEQRLQDKDQVIAELRAERAIMQGRMVIYENTIMPLASRAGAQVVASSTPTILKPNFPASASAFAAQLPKSRWEIAQEEHYRRQDEEEAEKAQREAEQTKQ